MLSGAKHLTLGYKRYFGASNTPERDTRDGEVSAVSHIAPPTARESAQKLLWL